MVLVFLLLILLFFFSLFKMPLFAAPLSSNQPSCEQLCPRELIFLLSISTHPSSIYYFPISLLLKACTLGRAQGRPRAFTLCLPSLLKCSQNNIESSFFFLIRTNDPSLIRNLITLPPASLKVSAQSPALKE